MGVRCKIFGHKWIREDVRDTSTIFWGCKRCKALKIKKQFIGTAITTEFDSDMQVISEKMEITRGN